MASTGRSRSSQVLCPLSPPQTLLNHQQRASASPCNIKCLCSPTTHPGSFRCAFHRSLENEKSRTLNTPSKLNNSGNTTSDLGLNLRKKVLVNLLARITSVESERLRISLAASMVKPSPIHIGRRFDFRPRPSRFALSKDHGLISRFCRL